MRVNPNDPLGVPIPMGSGGNDAKRLLRISPNSDDELLNMLVQSRLSLRVQSNLAWLYSLAPDHQGIISYIKAKIAASIGVDGEARREFMQTASSVMVPSWLHQPNNNGHKKNGNHGAATVKDKKDIADDY